MIQHLFINYKLFLNLPLSLHHHNTHQALLLLINLSVRNHRALAAVVAIDGKDTSEGENDAGGKDYGIVDEDGLAEHDGAGRDGEEGEDGIVCTHDGVGAEPFEGDAQIHHLECH